MTAAQELHAQHALSEEVRALLQKKGFERTTSIQKLAFPVVAEGRNALIIAPTGFGKTEAVLLPLLGKIEKDGGGIQLLYITPLRALNRDLLGRIMWWAEHLGVSVSVRHGDTSQAERARQARAPPQILITTPETLGAILPAKKIGIALKNVKFVIVDEVHELYVDKRGAQLSVALERLKEKTGKPFQRIGLSATIGSPESVAKFLCPAGNCEVVSLPTERKIHLRVERPEPGEQDAELGKNLFLDGAATARLRRLSELIAEKKTLAFVNTRQMAETLSSRLIKLDEEIGVHHGSLSKEARVAMEKEFKEGGLRGLITTSSLELGIDIGDVERVVQYMSPRQVSRLLQRVGRSGHSTEKIPEGVVITSDADDVFEAAVIARRAGAGLLERQEPQEAPLDVIAHQLAGLALDYGEISLEQAHKIITRAWVFRNLSPEQLKEVAQQLNSQRLLWLNGMLRKRRETILYYYSNLSMIPSEHHFRVKNAVTNKNISTLDEGFVAGLEEGSVFITKGLPWKALDISDEEIVVEPCEDISAAIPDWEGEQIPVPFEVAQEVGELRRKISKANDEEVKELARAYHVSAAALKSAKEILPREHVPDEKNVLLECCEDVVVVHVCGGSLINDSLARVLSALLTERFGASVKARADPYRVVLQLPEPASAEEMKALAKKKTDARAALERNISNSTLFRYKFIQEAKAFGLISDSRAHRLNPRVISRLYKTPIYKEALATIFHNYFDVRGCQRLLDELREGKLKLTVITVGEPTPLARSALVKISTSAELIAPIEPSSEILKAFAARLLEQRAKFYCTHCRKMFYRLLKELGKKVLCEHCGSVLVAPIPRFVDAERIKKAGARHRDELARRASLNEAYGKRAAIALYVYGVGSRTAARVLQNVRRNDSEFFRDLLEAQKQFIKTKRYWKRR